MRGCMTHVNIMVHAIDNGDDHQDEDWDFDKLWKKIKKRLARGKSSSAQPEAIANYNFITWKLFCYVVFVFWFCIQYLTC